MNLNGVNCSTLSSHRRSSSPAVTLAHFFADLKYLSRFPPSGQRQKSLDTAKMPRPSFNSVTVAGFFLGREPVDNQSLALCYATVTYLLWLAWLLVNKMAST